MIIFIIFFYALLFVAAYFAWGIILGVEAKPITVTFFAIATVICLQLFSNWFFSLSS